MVISVLQIDSGAESLLLLNNHNLGINPDALKEQKGCSIPRNLRSRAVVLMRLGADSECQMYGATRNVLDIEIYC
jgi:hypothetical protein